MVWVNGPIDVSYEKRLKALKLQSFEKKRDETGSVLTHYTTELT